MRKFGGWLIILILTSSNLMKISPAYGQEAQRLTTPSDSVATSKEDSRTLAELILQLQTQLQGLNSEIGQLRAEAQSTRVEMAALRKDLNVTKGQSTSREGTAAQATAEAYASTGQPKQVSPPVAPPASGDTAGQRGEEQLSNLEEALQLANQKNQRTKSNQS